MSKVYIFLADGFEDVEGLTVVDLMRRADVDLETVSIKETTAVTTARGVPIVTDRIFSGTDFSDGDMLVLPGGMPGTRYLAAYEPLGELLKQYYKEGKLVAAICAAPSVLASLGILEGKRATSHPSFIDKLGGALTCEDPVVIDGNVITSRGMGTAIDFGLCLVSLLAGQEKADEIANAIVYRR